MPMPSQLGLLRRGYPAAAAAAARKNGKLLEGTPAALGFRMPAEWEPHDQCWIGWPDAQGLWRDAAAPAQKAFANVVNRISRFEPVTVCCSAGQYARVADLMEHKSNVRVVEMSARVVWMRDLGPTFVVREGKTRLRREIAGVDWQYNAYGGFSGSFGAEDPHLNRRKRQEEYLSEDNLVARKILELERVPRFKTSFVLEGGSIHVDGEGRVDMILLRNHVLETPAALWNIRSAGLLFSPRYLSQKFSAAELHPELLFILMILKFRVSGAPIYLNLIATPIIHQRHLHLYTGTCITTEQCLCHGNRNPHMSKDEIEKQLKIYLGVSKVIWLPKGLYGDEMISGHVDNICCFAGPSTVLLSWIDDTSDPQYAHSAAAFDILSSTTDAKGRKLDIIKIHVPGPLYTTEEEGLQFADLVDKGQERLAGSYVNFYIANGGIIAPAFGDRWDEEARKVLEKAFPNHEVVMVEGGREIVLGGGNIHCATQQQPALCLPASL